MSKLYGETNSREQREVSLQEKFNELMPCKDCKLTQICKYFNSIKRLDYDPEIFTISISCKSQQRKEDDSNGPERYSAAYEPSALKGWN